MKRSASVLLASFLVASTVQGATVDEVVVSGARLDEVREQITHLEDQFYERYNALNTNRDFDIRCLTEARTGTRLVQRSCRPAYEQAALEEQIRARSTNIASPTRGATMPAGATIERRRREFQKNMQDVTARDAQLADLLRRRVEVTSQYEAMRRQMFGPKLLPETRINEAPAAPARR